MPQLMDKSAPVVPWLGAPDLRLQLSERMQYLTLGISVVLLLLALGVLAWQAYWCCASTSYTNKGMGWYLNHVQSCTAGIDTIFFTGETIINTALFSL